MLLHLSVAAGDPPSRPGSGSSGQVAALWRDLHGVGREVAQHEAGVVGVVVGAEKIGWVEKGRPSPPGLQPAGTHPYPHSTTSSPTPGPGPRSSG